MRKLSLVSIAVLAMAWSSPSISDDASVDHPSGYRTWQHVKSMIIQPGHALEDPFGGIHHIYANPKAMNGLAKGQYVDGAVFVFDLLDYDDSNLMVVETSRKRVDVMQYDGKNFSETGGWGFTTFIGDSKTERIVQDVVVSCFACHTSAKASNYVFSKFRP